LFALLEIAHDLTDRDIGSGLQYFDADFKHFGESCENVVFQDHVGNGFGSTGELIGELREVGTDWLSGNRTQ